MLIFVSIFGMGAIVLIFNLVFGHDTDSDLSGGGDIDGADGPSVFSARMISLLLIGFGAVGFGMRTTTDASMAISSLAGLAGAIVMGGIGFVILRAFYSTQASSTVTDRDVVGSTGHLTDAIPEGKLGQMSCEVRGQSVTFIARSDGNRAISRGAQVQIIGKSGGTVTVKELN